MQRIVEKKTGTYADALEAIGTASLLEDLGFTGVTVGDHGAFFLVESANEVAPETWAPPTIGYRYIWEKSKEQNKPAVECLDYEAERGRSEAWKKFQQANRKTRRKANAALEQQDMEAPAEPDRDFRTAAILASMRKGWNGDRDLAKWIQEHPVEARAWVRQCLGARNGPLAECPSITNSQVLNPIAGKGVHAAKTELRSPGSVPGQLIDAFAEWMKLRGLWRGMLLYRVGDDFKFFVVEPGNAPVHALARVKRELEGWNLWGGIRLDIEAALRCAEILILHSDAVQSEDRPLFRLRGCKPKEIIAGLRQAYFLSLGNAAALMNDAFLPLPGWFRTESPEDANDYLAIIREAIGGQIEGERKYGCLHTLSEEKSDDGRILQQYRSWLLTGDLFELLWFHHQYAVHLMRSDYPRPFSTEILERLIVKAYSEEYPVKEIIENEGFRSVARAVRNTTIYAISIPNSKREVRFGLAQKWKQKLKDGDKAFLAEVADFIQAQNWEIMHRLDGRGHVVSTSDLEELVALVQEYGAELVGSLLLAYGYARAPKLEEEAASSAAKA